jgi:hypothetical protein
MANERDPSAEKPGRTIAEMSIALAAGLGLALTAMFLCVVPLAGNLAGARDFVVYWATGQQLVHHANPYDAEAMGQIERGAGLSPGYGVLYMRNPPWGLPLVAPLGLVGVRAGALLWSLMLAVCLAASVLLLWRMQGRPRNRLHWLGLSFAPALVCLFVGQTALFALLGYVLFLRLQATRPFLAGMSLWLCALKPHLFLPIGVVLVAWVLVSRSYRLVAGAAAAMAASCALTTCIAPAAWTGYIQMMRAPGIAKEFIPCLSTALRLWLRPQAMWIEYLPVALGCAWAIGYYWMRRQAWDWAKDGSLPLLVSLLLAPYCWVYDQALAIPALLDGAYRTGSQHLLTALALASVLIELELVSGIKIPSALYLWTAPAWLAWYLMAQRSGVGQAAGAPEAADRSA